ncbi:MAG: helix-turn-helix domain-containing protein [Chlamydiales bacterium]
MHSEMVRLGEIFRGRREEKKLLLKEIENATSIRISYLQAIEEGDFGKLISPIYAHGFISKYALFLEMDPEKLIGEHPYVKKILTDKRAYDFTVGISALEVRGSPGGEVKWLPNFIWVSLSVVGILIFWFLVRYFGFF